MNTMKTLVRPFCLLSISTLVACASFKTRDKNEDAVAKIKKVAIVAYAADLPAAAKLSLSLDSGKVGAEKGGTMLAQTSTETDQIFHKTSKAFQNQIGWSVLDSKAMIATPGYKSAFSKTMDGWQNKMPVSSGKVRYLVNNMMDGDSLRILGIQGRNQLIKDLGVDAIIVATVRVNLVGTSIMGIGNLYPQPDLSFSVYALDQENPIWFEGQLKGEQSKESVGKTGFFDDKKAARLAVDAIDGALVQIGKRVE